MGENSEKSSEGSESSSADVHKRLDEEPWFHGFLPKDELEKLFKDDGDFAVRLSLDERSSLMINVQHKKQIKGFNIIETKKNTYYVEKKEFESVGDLIAYHLLTKAPVTEGSGILLVRAIPTQKWELDNETLTRKTKLGGGEYGKVWKGLWKQKTNREITVAFKECLEKAPAAKLELLNEAKTMLAVQTPNSHPNIVRCHGIACKKEPLYLVLEFCEGGTLLEHLKSNGKKIDDKTRLRFCKEITQALKHLGEKKCVHRDVAARNVLLGKNLTAKLSDFGLAIMGDSHKTDKKIPIKWSAPESLAKEECSHKSDVWSLGVTIWEIYMNGDEPWPGKSIEAVRKELSAGKTMDLPKTAPPPVQDAMKKMWSHDPGKRPAAKGINLP